MDDKLFSDLLQSVRDMGTHMHGKSARGTRISELAEPEPRAIRKVTKLSQSEFAQLVGVPVKTLQNWEQKRTRPTGPARALLRAIAKDFALARNNLRWAEGEKAKNPGGAK